MSLDSNQRYPLAGRFIVKALPLAGGPPAPFAGSSDGDGYFFIPALPEGEDYVIVCYDLVTGEQRSIEHTGTAVGGPSMLFFDFVHDQAPTVEVTQTGDSGEGSLRAAVADAIPGDQIVFSPEARGTITLSSPIVIGRSISIVGPGAEELRVSGDAGTRIFEIEPGVPVTLSGLTLAEGSADQGGAIYNEGQLTLVNMVIEDNTAEEGGAIYNGTVDRTQFDDPTLTVESTDFLNNQAATHGGAIFNHGAALTEIGRIRGQINESSFENNVAQDGSGGAVFIGQGSHYTFRDTEFTNNEAGVNGGAVRIGQNVAGGTHEFIGTRLEGNTAEEDGGAIHYSGDIVLTETLVIGNEAGRNGGGLARGMAADADITASTIANNTAGQNGGGIHNASRLIVTNSTVHGNTAADSGGGIYGGGTTIMSHVTITENEAETGGGIFGGGRIGGSESFRNSVIAGNRADQGPDYQQSGPDADVDTLGHNFVGSGDGNTFVSGQNGDIVGAGSPELSDLGDAGGPTPTAVPEAGSPLIDAVPQDQCRDTDDEPLTTDQRGVGRPQGNACDIGAVEAGGAPE